MAKKKNECADFVDRICSQYETLIEYVGKVDEVVEILNKCFEDVEDARNNYKVGYSFKGKIGSKRVFVYLRDYEEEIQSKALYWITVKCGKERKIIWFVESEEG